MMEVSFSKILEAREIFGEREREREERERVRERERERFFSKKNHFKRKKDGKDEDDACVCVFDGVDERDGDVEMATTQIEVRGGGQSVFQKARRYYECGGVV